MSKYVLRQFIDSLTKLVAWIRRNRVVKPKTEVVKVNIGSGLSVTGGWINIDGSLNAFFSTWPRFVLKILYRMSGASQYYSQEEYLRILKEHTFVHHNVEYGLPFPDRSVHYLYSSHMLEHLFREDCENLIREAYRVLKTGGTFRICVPDLEYAIALYRQGNKERALAYFFTTSKLGRLGRHQYLYDFDLLGRLLKENGFTEIRRYSCGQGKTPNAEELDIPSEETLYLEAGKLAR